jgi:serine/threonine protein kinase
MAHLHTHFVNGAASGSDQSPRESHEKRPVIHRDLKSDNVLLHRRPPLPGDHDEWEITMKIADFGLARDKDLDDLAMTKCGSVFWNAPEVLSGEEYDEKVDLFSYAMTLVELVHGTRPWEDTGSTAEAVPFRVVGGERPDSQLKEATSGMSNLIKSCWAQTPGDRPTFPVVVVTLEEMSTPRESVQEYATRRAAEHMASVDNVMAGANGGATDSLVIQMPVEPELEPEPELEEAELESSSSEGGSGGAGRVLL